jgi:hypothetical protein
VNYDDWQPYEYREYWVAIYVWWTVYIEIVIIVNTSVPDAI